MLLRIQGLFHRLFELIALISSVTNMIQVRRPTANDLECFAQNIPKNPRY